MEIREIREKDYAKAIELATLAIKELYGVAKPELDFNFKIKNVFVTPGNITRAMFQDDMMVGLFVVQEQRFLHNDKKKANVNFFYMLPEYRTNERMDQVFEYIENFAITNGNFALGFDTSLPFFSNHVMNNFDVKQESIHFERLL